MRKLIRSSYESVFNRIKLLSLEMLIVLAVFFAALFTVGFLIHEIFFEETFALDQNVFNFLERFISDRSNTTMSFFTFFGSHQFLVPANLILIAYAFFVLKDKWFAIKIASVAFSSLLLMFFLKLLFGRPRPLEPLLSPASGLSFPSGHAFMSFAFFGLWIYIVFKKVNNKVLKTILIILLLMIVIIVGISRIYLRVHYFSDVIAGLCLGMIWLVISLAILNKMEHRSIKKLPIQ